MADQCRQPLRVAVTGDVSTGKSTLVNALLAQERARVCRRETTSEVTWYRHPALAPGVSLGPRHRYEAVSFRLADRIILADTPGVNSRPEREQVTDAMLKGAATAAGSATVLLYLCHKTVSAGAKARIDQFSRLAAGVLGHGFNVVLVGAKADEGGVDTADIAANLESEAGLLGAQAVPVAQQLAVVARTGALRLAHLATLRAIARDRDLREDYAPDGWDMLRLGWGLRERRDGDIEALWKLSPTTFAIVGSLLAIDAGNVRDVADLASLWEELSGLRALEDVLERLADDADVLTVNAVTGRLQRLGVQLGPERARMLRERLSELRGDTLFTGLEERTAALALRTRLFADVPEDERHEAMKLLAAVRPRSAAQDLARRWRRRAAQPSRSTFARHIAGIIGDAAAGQS
jgi:50S ribosome-binding GTPase